MDFGIYEEKSATIPDLITRLMRRTTIKMAVIQLQETADNVGQLLALTTLLAQKQLLIILSLQSCIY